MGHSHVRPLPLDLSPISLCNMTSPSKQRIWISHCTQTNFRLHDVILNEQALNDYFNCRLLVLTNVNTRSQRFGSYFVPKNARSASEEHSIL